MDGRPVSGATERRASDSLPHETVPPETGIFKTGAIHTDRPPLVLHVDETPGWRGGQQQALSLLTGLRDRAVPSILACRDPSELGRRCEAAGIPRLVLPLAGELDVFSAFRIARFCRGRGVDILQAHTAHALAVCLWARLFRPPLRIVAVRRVDFHIGADPWSRLKYRSRGVHRIVCISEGIRSVLLSDGIDGRKLEVIRSGIDIHRFDGMRPDAGLRADIGVPEGGILIGTVASMAGHKDYPNLLAAAARVLAADRRVVFCAVGDGPEEKSVRRLASDLGLGSRFHFAGFRADAIRYLKAFDIFVLASKKEGLGTSILDAQAAGVPVVACETGGIPEAVRNGINGLLVQPRNPAALADALLRLASDPSLRTRLAAEARRTVGSFDIRATVEAYIGLYGRLVRPDGTGEKPAPDPARETVR
jgi:glycosyltransferase involved in cell wall biosynthesis